MPIKINMPITNQPSILETKFTYDKMTATFQFQLFIYTFYYTTKLKRI